MSIERNVPSPASITASSPDASAKMVSYARIELLVAVIIALWIIFLHGLFLFHAGPLWRDEVGTIDFASMPTLSDIWHNLRYDNFPPLFVALARVWTLSGMSGDFSYRILGFLIGLATLAVIWFGARRCGARAPLLALALYGANPLAIRVGDSMRPYGLGIALTMLTLALIWKFVENPRPRNLFWATLVAVLAVQSLYHNAIFILAFSLAAWSVTLARRQWKTAAQVLVIGVVAALSLLPHLSNIRKGEEWMGVTKWPVQFSDVWQALLGAFNPVGGFAEWVWGGLVILALVIALRRVAHPTAWNILYCAVALLTAIILHLSFLRMLGLLPQPWYLLILLAPAALTLDAILASAASPPSPPQNCGEEGRGEEAPAQSQDKVCSSRLAVSGWPLGRAGLAVLLILSGASGSSRMVRLRETNMDWIAASLKKNAKPQDLILVSPWYYAVSLQRYYGTNGLTTLPPMDEFRIHRYDLLQKQMATADPIAPLLQDIEKALRSGHALWIVGEYKNPPASGPPPFYPPYQGQVETPMPKYRAVWLYQIGKLVKAHAVEGGLWTIQNPPGVTISPLEDIPLIYFHGWKEE